MYEHSKPSKSAQAQRWLAYPTPVLGAADVLPGTAAESMYILLLALLLEP